MDSNDPTPDLELIAALADGRLSAAERARAMKLLAESDEALELYASTLRHQAESPDAKVIPIATARRSRRWRVVVAPVAVAAALAVVVVPAVIRRGARDEGAGAKSYATELSRDPRFAAGLQPNWEQRWSVTRGGDASTSAQPAGSAAESRLAFRLGVRSVDLQVALSRGDTALAARLASEIVETLKGVAFSDIVGTRFADLKTHIATDTRDQSIDRASAAERELRNLLGDKLLPTYAYGQWASAAELAAQTHDAAFFDSGRGAGFIQSASKSGGLPSEDVDALRSIDAQVKSGLTDAKLGEVQGILQQMIRRRGG